MSSATQTDPGAVPQQSTANPLDASIAATDRQKFIRDGASQVLGVRPDKVLGMLKQVWKTSRDQKDFTDQELYLGMSMVARYLLDPVAKEIYLGRDKNGRLMIIIGIDGFIKILDRTDHYDGFEWEYGWDKEGEMEWCEVKIFSKKRSHPTVYRGFAKEYKQLAGFMHDKIPWHMLRLFTLRHATRLFTPMGAVVTEDEANWMGQAAAPANAPAPPDSLDELTDHLEQSFEQPAKSPGNGETAAAEPEKPAEPAQEKPPQAEPEDTQVIDSYDTMIQDAETIGGTDGCDAIKTLADAAFQAGDVTVKQHGAILAMVEAKKEKIRRERGAGSNK